MLTRLASAREPDTIYQKNCPHAGRPNLLTRPVSWLGVGDPGLGQRRQNPEGAGGQDNAIGDQLTLADYGIVWSCLVDLEKITIVVLPSAKISPGRRCSSNVKRYASRHALQTRLYISFLFSRRLLYVKMVFLKYHMRVRGVRERMMFANRDEAHTAFDLQTLS